MKDNLKTKVSEEAQSHAFLVGAVTTSAFYKFNLNAKWKKWKK